MTRHRSYAEFRTGWPVVLAAMLGIGLGLSPVPFYTTGTLAPQLAREFGWNFKQIMTGFPILTFGVLIMSPLVGWLADRYGVRRLALTSCVLFSLSFMSQALMNGALQWYYAIWIGMAVVGAGTLPVTWTRAVNHRFEVHKGLALGFSLLGTGLFGFVSKPLTAWLLQHFGLRGTYVALGALPLILVLPVGLWALRDRPEDANAAASRELAARQAALTPGLTPAQALRDWRLWLMGLAFVPISFAIGGPIPNMENILRTAGFHPDQVVSLAQLIGLSVIVGRVGGGLLIDRIWAPAVALVLLLLTALACIGLADPQLNYRTAQLSIGALGFSAGLEYDLMAFFVARYLGMKAYGSLYGVLYGAFALGAGFGPVVFGAMYDRTHSYSSMLHLSGALFVIGSFLLLLLGRYRYPVGVAADAGAPRFGPAQHSKSTG